MDETQIAARTGDVAKLQELVGKGVSMDRKDEDERTPLHWASATGCFDVVTFLLEHAQVVVNVQDDAGWTPLMSAASAGHCEIVRLLLNKYERDMIGADANIANENGQIPLHYHKGRLELAELLLDYTRDINQADNTGKTPLMRAIGGKPSPAVVSLLLDHGANVNCCDVDGNTPLHLALSEEYEDMARFLLKNGANPNAKNREEERCIDLAKSAFRAEIDAFMSKKAGRGFHKTQGVT